MKPRNQRLSVTTKALDDVPRVWRHDDDGPNHKGEERHYHHDDNHLPLIILLTLLLQALAGRSLLTLR